MEAFIRSSTWELTGDRDESKLLMLRVKLVHRGFGSKVAEFADTRKGLRGRRETCRSDPLLIEHQFEAARVHFGPMEHVDNWAGLVVNDSSSWRRHR
jgi:hypothetical protein